MPGLPGLGGFGLDCCSIAVLAKYGSGVNLGDPEPKKMLADCRAHPGSYSANGKPCDDPTWTSGGGGGSDGSGTTGPIPDQTGYQEYVAACTRAYFTCVALHPDDVAGCKKIFDKCRTDGQTIFLQGKKLQTEGACSRCGYNDVQSCVDCYSQRFIAFLQAIGVNLAVGIIILFGVYLLFKPEVDQAIRSAVKAAK